MTDIALETSRGVIIVIVFSHLLINGRKEKIHEQNCWSYILIGFAFLFFGMAIDITDTEATIIWTTDEPATSGVSYNDGTAYGVVQDDNPN